MIEQSTKDMVFLIRDTLRRISGGADLHDAQAQQLAIAFTFLRRIDCMIAQYDEDCYVFYTENKDKLSDKQLDKKLREISGGYPFYNVSSYTFEYLLNTDLALEVALNSYLQGFSSNVRNILSDMNFSQNVAVLMRKSKYLVDLFEYFHGLDLSLNTVNNKQFIDLITLLASYGHRYSGMFATPIGLSKLICECLFCNEICEDIFYEEESDVISVYDPACGTGSLLAYAGEKAKSLANNQENVYLIGHEISTFYSAIANVLILLTGDEYSFADDVNTLVNQDFHDITFKYVVSDLPLGLSWAPFKDLVIKESMREDGRYFKGLPSTKDSQFLFIQDIVSRMDDMGGRAAFITSASVLNMGSVTSGESRIRRWLFESGLVETIIALPAGILSPHTNIPVYLWILSCVDRDFNNNNEYWEKMDGKVRLIDTSKLLPSTNRFTLEDDFIDAVVREYKSLKDTTATRIVNKEAFGFYEVNIREGSQKETVRISLDTDINEYISKERKPYAKSDISIDYSSVEKGFSVDFSQFFKPEEIPIPSLVEETDKILSIVDSISSLKQEIKSFNEAFGKTSSSDIWREIPLRAVVEIILANSKPHIKDENGLPIISVATLRGELKDEELYAETKHTKRISSSDVIFIKTGANAGEIFRGRDGLLSPTLGVIKSVDNSIVLQDYLYYLLKGYEKSFRLLVNGSAIKSLNTNAILDLKCLIPPVGVQAKIVGHLDNLVGKIDKIIISLNSSDNAFAQFRQSLIESIVRGKI